MRVVVFSLRAKRYCNQCGAYIGEIPYECGTRLFSRWFLIYLGKWLKSLIIPYKEEISSVNCDKNAS